MKLRCKVLGHWWVTTHITLPRRWVCRRCGKVVP